MICYGQQMNLLSAAFANALAEELSPAQMEFLSSFLQSVGENLSTIAAAVSLCDDDI